VVTGDGSGMGAINLYYKLGFKKLLVIATPYERSNIQMELDLQLVNF
jgi:hypothetical protein